MIGTITIVAGEETVKGKIQSWEKKGIYVKAARFKEAIELLDGQPYEIFLTFPSKMNLPGFDETM